MTFISVFISSILLLVHPLHVSVTEITFDQKEKELEIMIRIFTDDLELAIREAKKNANLNLLKPQDATIDKLVWEYLEPRVKISADQSVQNLKYLGHEIDEDVMIFYIQVEPIEKFETLTITNSILTELYDDQSNLVNVTVSESVKSLRLVRSNPSGKLSFDHK